MPTTRNDRRGISILIGDSSGAGGLSTATVLDQLMKRVQIKENLPNTPLVEDYFDIVAGAGTGAIVMALAGRLGMPTEQVTECFARLSDKVFSGGKLVGNSAFKASKMERELKAIIQRETGNREEPMLDNRPNRGKCKVMVFARSAHNMNAGIPTIFRSYRNSDNLGPSCAMWQALRAATAHPEVFKSIEIETDGASEPYVDAAMGCGNPIEHVLTEAKMLYPGRRVACIISIGGGHPRTIRIPEPKLFSRAFPTATAAAMRDIATDNERMAQTMARRFQAVPNVYFRFNVDQGMQNIGAGDWNRLGEVVSHTRMYMQRVETSEMAKRAGEAMCERKGVVPTRYIDGEIQLEAEMQLAGIKECPIPTPVYTERHVPMQRAIDCLTSDSSDRRVFVFHGLGGAGKTQLALQTVEKTWEHWSDVLFVDATSVETLTSTMKGCAIARRIGKTHEDTIRWLGTYTKRWLLVFDNADDASLDLPRYFPSGTHGRILITTRGREIASLAQGPNSECNVSEMEPEEAKQLLMTVTRVKEGVLSNKEKDAAKALLQDLGYLALAIVQAGAYIWCTSCGFGQYRDLYAARPRDMLRRYSKTSRDDDYKKTVYDTWMMNYQQLSEKAQKMLWLLAYLQRDRITQEIFRRAASRANNYQPASPLTEIDLRALANVKEYLKSFLIDDKWDPCTFLTLMEEIMSYSLIAHDRVNETYVLHVLVQDWIRTVIPYSSQQALSETAFLLAISIDRGNSAEDYAHHRAVELHIDRILHHCEVTPGDIAAIFGYTMHQNGRYERAKELQLRALNSYKMTLGQDAEATLLAKKDLATAYCDQGQYDQAEILENEILETRMRVSGKEHLDTLAAMSELSATYSRQGFLEKAGAMQKHVLEARTTFLGPKHPDTLCAMSNLAVTYHGQNLYKEAEWLQLQVLEARKELSGDDHPDTLTAMGNLAVTYSQQKLYKQAELLQVQVLEARRRLLGNEHPKTLSAMNNLANTYFRQGLYKQVVASQVQVLEARKRLLGDGHPDTLCAMNNLAITFFSQGLYEQAESHFQRLVQASKMSLGIHHPITIAIAKNLARTYRCFGPRRQRLYEALMAEIDAMTRPEILQS